MNKSDERIVRMKFDSKDFERGISRTLKQLDKLQDKLKFKDSAKGFEAVNKSANKVNLDKPARAIDKFLDKLKFKGDVKGFSDVEKASSKITLASPIKAIDKFLDKLSFRGGTSGFEAIKSASEKLNFHAAEGSLNSFSKSLSLKGATAGLEAVGRAADKLTFTTASNSAQSLAKDLNFRGGTVGLEAIDSASKKVTFDSMAQAIDTINSRLSTMGIVGVTAIQNITNQAMDAAKNLTKNLTITPVKTGFQEYQTQMKAFQVIQANTGASTDEINESLNELNTYADKTIYNFTQMTDNFGKFVAQGVPLERAQKAIMGLSNLAAISGATPQDLTRATYQMSQALGGTIRKIDWNSLRNANMATQQLKDNLIEVAKEEGIDVDEMIKAKGTFEDTLEEGWLTGDLFVETMQRYTDTTTEFGRKAYAAAAQAKTVEDLWNTVNESIQSGWTSVWQSIVGDADESKEMLTELQDYLTGVDTETGEAYGLISKKIQALTSLFQKWHDLGGRENLLDALKTSGKSLVAVLGALHEGFQDAIPPITAKDLNDLTVKFKAFAKELIPTEEVLNKLRSIGSGLGGIFKILGNVVKFVATGFGVLLEWLKPVGEELLNIVAFVGDLIYVFSDATNGIESFWNAFRPENALKTIKGVQSTISKIFETLGNSLHGFAEGFKKVFQIEKYKDALSNVFTPFIEGVTKAKEGFDEFTDKVNKATSGGVFETLYNICIKIGTVIGTLTDNFFKFAAGLFGGLNTAASGVTETLTKFDFSNIIKLLASASFVSFVKNIDKILDTLNEGIGGVKDAADSISNIGKSIVGVLDAVKDTLIAYQTTLKASALFKIAAAIAALAVSLLLVGSIKQDRLFAAVVAISDMFAALYFFSTKLSKKLGNGKQFYNLKTVEGYLIGIGVAILMMASAVKVLGSMNFGGFLEGIIGLIVVMKAVLKLTQDMSKIKPKNLKQISKSLFLMAIDIRLFASTVKTLGKLKVGDLAKGLGGLLITLYAVYKFMSGLSKLDVKGGKLNAVGFSMITMATGLLIMTQSVKQMGKMNDAGLLKGLAGLSIILFAIDKFAQSMSKVKSSKVLAVSFALDIMSVGILVITQSVKQMGVLNDTSLLKGLAGLAVIMLTIGKFAESMANIKVSRVLSAAFALDIMSVGILLIVQAVKQLGGMELPNLVMGLVGLGSALIIISRVAESMKKSMKGAAALTIASVGILIISNALKELSKADMTNMVASLISLTALLLVLSKTLSSMNGSIAGAGALTIVSIGITNMAIGLRLLASVPIPNLVVSLGALIGIIALLAKFSPQLAAVAPYITSFSTSLLVFSAAVAVFGAGVTLLSVGLTMLGPALLTFFTSLAGALTVNIANIISIIKSIAQLIGEAIVAIAQAIRDHAGDVIDAIGQTIVTILDGLAKWVPQITESLVELIIKVLIGVADAVRNNAGAIWYAIEDIIGALATVFLTILSSFLRSIPVIGAKLSNGVDSLINTIDSDLKSEKKRLVDSGEDTGKGIAEGVDKASDTIKQSGKDAVGAANEGAKEEMDKSDLPKDMIDSIKGKFPIQLDEFKNLGTQGGTAITDAQAQAMHDQLYKLEEAGATGGTTITDAQAKAMTDALSLDNLKNAGILQGRTVVDGNVAGMTSDESKKKTHDAGASNVDSYDQGAKDSADNAKQTGVETSTAAAEGEKSAGSKHTESGSSNTKSYGDGLTLEKSVALAKGAEVSAESAKGEKSKDADHAASGKGSGASYSSGLSSSGPLAYGSAQTVATQANGGLASKKSDTTDTGKYFTIGFGNGITDKKVTSWLLDKINKLGTACYNALNASIQTGSPSKLTKKTGRYFSLGFAIGIDERSREAKRSAIAVGTGAIEALAESIESSNDFSPVITPVLDMSNVNSGLGSLSGSFSGPVLRANAVADSFTPQTVQTMDLLRREMSDLTDQLSKDLQNGMNNGDQTYTFVTNTQLDGRQIARSTATYTQQELNRLNKLNQRMEGYR